MTNVEALKNVYVALGGSADDVAEVVTNVEMLRAIFVQLGGDPDAVSAEVMNAAAIDAIADVANGFIKPSGTISITENGSNIDVAQYASANVMVDDMEMLLRGYGNAGVDGNTLNMVGGGNDFCKYAVAGRTGIKKVVFVARPGSGSDETNVSRIPQYCFIECTNLEEVDMSNVKSNTYFVEGAFYDCAKLHTLTLPSSAPDSPPGCRIGFGAFTNCTALKTLDATYVRIFDESALVNSSIETLYLSTLLSELGPRSLNASSLTDIYYTGTQVQWEAITGLSGAGIPQSCTIHYEYTPTE